MIPLNPVTTNCDGFPCVLVQARRQRVMLPSVDTLGIMIKMLPKLGYGEDSFVRQGLHADVCFVIDGHFIMLSKLQRLVM